MADITIKIHGLEEIRRRFNQAPMKITAEITRAIQRSIIVIERNVKREAPVNKQTGGGNLRQSVKSSMTGRATGQVEATAQYAAAVEFGTRPHEIRPIAKKALANRRTGEFFGKLVRHPGTAANPFFERGVKASEKDVNTYFGQVLINALK